MDAGARRARPGGGGAARATLYVSGALNMLDHPDLTDVATVRRLLHAFEEKARLIDLLSRIAQERGVQIIIGAENPLEEMRE